MEIIKPKKAMLMGKKKKKKKNLNSCNETEDNINIEFWAVLIVLII